MVLLWKIVFFISLYLIFFFISFYLLIMMLFNLDVIGIVFICFTLFLFIGLFHYTMKLLVIMS